MADTALGDETLDALVAGSDEPLVVATRATIRLLVFNRPSARNALSRGMRQTYARELQAAEADPDITAVIVTGAHGYFSAGVDVKENPPGSNLPMIRPHPVEVTRGMTKPVIAMVDGPCITGGLEVALSCSFVVASTRSSFADTHIKIGIFPGWGLASLLSSAIGARRAAQMQMSGEFIDAQRAYDWGIVNELVPSEALLARGLELANRIGAYDQDKIRRYVDLNRRLDGLATDEALAAEFTVVDRIRAGL
jgi:enoyl-CoA hydratase